MGSCGHCHGPTAEASGLQWRFDVCEAAAFASSGFVFPTPTRAGAGRQANMLAGDVTSGTMPPAPGAALATYEREVLVNWAALSAGSRCPKRPGNHAPTVKVVRRVVLEVGGTTVVLEVADADGDQVVGAVFAGPDCDPADTDAAAKAECLARPRALIPSTGRHTLTVESTDGLVVRLSDGWGAAVVQPLP
jgi:hypothetical protein